MRNLPVTVKGADLDDGLRSFTGHASRKRAATDLRETLSWTQDAVLAGKYPGSHELFEAIR